MIPKNNSWIDPERIRASTARDVVERIHAAAARDAERIRASLTRTRSVRGRVAPIETQVEAGETLEATP